MTDRAVSTTLNYVLALAVVTVLISGLFIAANDVVETQRERSINSELTVLGNQLASDLSALDRLVIASDAKGTARIASDLPTTVAGKPYSVDLQNSPIADRYEIELSTTQPAVTVTVVVRLETPLVSTSLGSGDLVLSYDGSTIEVDHA